jgi:hypothetical protein
MVEINNAEKNNDYSYILLCANDLNIKELYLNVEIIERIFNKFYNLKLKKEEEIKKSYIWNLAKLNLEEQNKSIEILNYLVELQKKIQNNN